MTRAKLIHKPVMLAEVLEALQPCDGGTYVDATFGRGGYSRAILEAAETTVYAIDQDPEALAAGQALAKDYPGRLILLAGNFAEMDELLPARALSNAASDEEISFRGVVLDIGISSPQIDDPARGFSFREDGPLDMRMSQEGPSAADYVNSLPEGQLADIIWRYGEEKRSRQVARAIVAHRQDQKIERTGELAEIVRGVVRASKDGIDPATRTFQALRIYVNDELGALKKGLEAAERLLLEGGRLVVVTFHSLEDRIVKLFLRERAGRLGGGSRHLPMSIDQGPAPTFSLPSAKALACSPEEARDNPRARSAKLRFAIRTDAPPWGMAGAR